MKEPAVSSLALLILRPFTLVFSLAAFDDHLNVSTSVPSFATDICLLLATDYHVTPRYRQLLYASLSPAVQRYHQLLLDSLSFPLARSCSFGIAASHPQNLRTHKLGLTSNATEMRSKVGFYRLQGGKHPVYMGVECYLQSKSPVFYLPRTRE